MDLKFWAQNELKNEERLLEKYRKVAAKTTAGNVKVCVRKGYVEEYYKLAGTSKYSFASTKDAKLISSIRLNTFAERAIRIIDNNIKKLTGLGDFAPTDFKSIKDSLPASYKLNELEVNILRQYGISFDDVELMGKTATASENPNFPDELKHITRSGVKVRSKNEAIIADILWDAGISFGYERQLTLSRKGDFSGDAVFYPDFTFSHGNKTIYWEHFGLMHEAAYSRNYGSKIDIYFKNGIYQPKNLIVTMDGPNGEINTEELIREVRKFVEYI